jgi:hypothetical protein
MAVKKSTQNCFNNTDCGPGYYCASNSTCKPIAKAPGILGNTSAKIGAGIVGTAVAALGAKVAKDIKENRAAKKEAKKAAELPKQKKGGNWIQGAIKKPGALREQLGVKKGETIPKAKLAAAAKKGGKLGQRARLAITLGKMKK